MQTGALLLPYGQAEIQPFATYQRRETSGLGFDTIRTLLAGVTERGELVSVLNNDLIRTEVVTRVNEVDAGLFFRVGLPFESQLEFSLPAHVVNQSILARDFTPSGLSTIQENNATGYALGDIRIGIAKTLLHEDGWLPDLVGRVTWDTDSGKLVDNDVFMGTGFNELIVSATVLKRQDPLAFTARLFYQKTFGQYDIIPSDIYNFERGDKYGFSVDATLAASPQTSLSMGLQQVFSSNDEINGISIAGTDTTSSVFTLGAASTIGRRLFFSATAGIGLTESAPDYFVNIAIPLRFDVPFKSLTMGN